jgi:chemotaxis family two-component system response regulator Rcp1
LAFLGRRGNYANAVKPDLVILDLNLPKRDGHAVLAAMRASPDLRKIPVVIFSTSQLSRDIARSYELGANCYVSKPGNLTEFFSMMKSIEKFWFGSVKLPPRGE